MKSRWYPARRINPAVVPADIRNTLLYSGSLTGLLGQLSPDTFNLELIQQAWGKPLRDEANVLGLENGRYALVREIFLKFDEQPLVYGRSIIPASTLTGNERRLINWGQRSLGDYLFSRHDVERGEIEIAKITLQDSAGGQIFPDHAEKNHELWGRRSIFYVRHKPLLVVEIFLPGFGQCVGKS